MHTPFPVFSNSIIRKTFLFSPLVEFCELLKRSQLVNQRQIHCFHEAIVKVGVIAVRSRVRKLGFRKLSKFNECLRNVKQVNPKVRKMLLQDRNQRVSVIRRKPLGNCVQNNTFNDFVDRLVRLYSLISELCSCQQRFSRDAQRAVESAKCQSGKWQGRRFLSPFGLCSSCA